MTTQTTGGDQMCPNCRALNSARAVVCRSCGINLDLYRQALPQIREREIEHARQHEEELATTAAATVAQEQERHRRQGRQQIILLLLVLSALAVLVITGAAVFRYVQSEQRARLDADYAAATACLAAKDYTCALDGYSSVLQRDATYAGARTGLTQSRLGLANQLMTAGQWEAAIRKLDSVLQDDPANQAALAALRDSYDRWIQDALGRGDFVRALGLRLQRNARFPNEPLAPLPTPTSEVEGEI